MNEKIKSFKILKVFGIVILSIIILILIFVGAAFGIHRFKLSQEWDYLNENGYVNLISAGDYNLDIHTYGNGKGKHTFVGMSGMGVQDFAISIGEFVEKFSDENDIVIIDRAGYSLSDDTDIPQTYERVVSDYRTVLKNAGYKAPYVLMGHSLGGDFATYWANKYPEEVEAVIYFDPAYFLGDISIVDTDEGFWAENDEFMGLTSRQMVPLQNMGLVRVYLAVCPQICEFYEKYDENTNKLAVSMFKHSVYTNAQASEFELYTENARSTDKIIKSNDVPKLYIDASTYTKEDMVDELKYSMQFIKSADSDEAINPYDDTQMQKLWEVLSKSREKTYNRFIKPYVERLGNCKYIRIPGNHYIFQHKPYEVAQACKDFINNN